mmetsp:Transcript_116421/g.362641  ORF Transcript_116421/g.362641 Transcript_116421/m.362641 type:complete len:369 (-) Transcript_116421:597-1703(-)
MLEMHRLWPGSRLPKPVRNSRDHRVGPANEGLTTLQVNLHDVPLVHAAVADLPVLWPVARPCLPRRVEDVDLDARVVQPLRERPRRGDVVAAAPKEQHDLRRPRWIPRDRLEAGQEGRYPHAAGDPQHPAGAVRGPAAEAGEVAGDAQDWELQAMDVEVCRADGVEHGRDRPRLHELDGAGDLIQGRGYGGDRPRADEVVVQELGSLVVHVLVAVFNVAREVEHDVVAGQIRGQGPFQLELECTDMRRDLSDGHQPCFGEPASCGRMQGAVAYGLELRGQVAHWRVVRREPLLRDHLQLQTAAEQHVAGDADPRDQAHARQQLPRFVIEEILCNAGDVQHVARSEVREHNTRHAVALDVPQRLVEAVA